MSVFMKQEHGETGLMAWVQILELASTSHMNLGKLFLSLSLIGLSYKAETRRLVTLYTQHIVTSDKISLSMWKYEILK